MLLVRIDDEPCAADVSGCEHLGDVIEACAGGLASRVVTRVAVDGLEIPDASLDRLEIFPIEGSGLVEIGTRDTRDVARASLDSSSDYAAEIGKSLIDAADQLRAGRIDEASRITAEASDAISVLLFAAGQAASILGEIARPLAGLDDELLPWLEAAVDAQKERDWLRVADYLEYEVAALLATWRRRVEEVRSNLDEEA